MVQRIPLKILVAIAVISTFAWVLSVMSLAIAARYLFGVALVAFFGACYAALVSPKGVARDKKRLTWFLVSTVAMIAPPLCRFCWGRIVERIAAGAGVPLLEVPGVWAWTVFFMGLGVVQPFLAAWFLGLAWKQSPAQTEDCGTFILTYSRPSHTWLVSVLKYVARLGASILATFAFTFCFVVVLMILGDSF
jgi:hypothetical protein